MLDSKNRKDSFLSACFYLNARSKQEISKLDKYLNTLSNFKFLTDEHHLKYEILSDFSTSEPNNLLELSDKYVNFTFFFKKPEHITYNKNLLNFISIIILLGDFYEFDFDDLYKYIIIALSQNWQNIVKDQGQMINSLKDRIKILNDSNCCISDQIIELSRKNKQYLNNLDIYRNFCTSVINKSKEKSKDVSSNNYSILESLGINLSLIQNIEIILKLES